MKKVISLLLAVVLIAGCGKSSVLPSSDVLSLSKLPPPIPPPAITSYDDIKVSNPKNEAEAYNTPFWFKAGLIAVSAIVISSIVFLGYNIINSGKRFDELFRRKLKRIRHVRQLNPRTHLSAKKER